MSIPNKIQVAAALAQQQVFEGELPVKALPRLQSAVEDNGAVIQVRWIARRQDGYPSLFGGLSGQLKLKCQRCGKSYDWTLDLQPELRLVFSEAEELQAMEQADPVLIENDQLPLRELTEDEVLLALPMLARCGQCRKSLETVTPVAGQEAVRSDNPFAALKGLVK